MVYLWRPCDVMLHVLINGSLVSGNEKSCKKNKKGGEDSLIASYTEKRADTLWQTTEGHVSRLTSAVIYTIRSNGIS